MESMSQRVFLIAGAGLLAATLAFVAVRHSHEQPRVEVYVPDVQRLQADLDDLNARIATIAPADDVPVHHVTREELRIARARLAEVESRLDELRLRIAARPK
jgi:hypothetical protein